MSVLTFTASVSDAMITRPKICGPETTREAVQALARQAGTLAGRTINPHRSLESAMAILKRDQRRRLAVIDGSGHLMGLLCLKRSGDGCCSDEGVCKRAAA